MRPSATVALHRALNAPVSGSAARGEDTDASDLDILVDTTDRTSLLDVAAISSSSNISWA